MNIQCRRKKLGTVSQISAMLVKGYAMQFNKGISCQLIYINFMSLIRDRREGHQRQYGIGSWYGTGDYYPPSSNRYGYHTFKSLVKIQNYLHLYTYQVCFFLITFDLTNRLCISCFNSSTEFHFKSKPWHIL